MGAPRFGRFPRNECWRLSDAARHLKAPAPIGLRGVYCANLSLSGLRFDVRGASVRAAKRLRTCGRARWSCFIPDLGDLRPNNALMSYGRRPLIAGDFKLRAHMQVGAAEARTATAKLTPEQTIEALRMAHEWTPT